MKRRVLFGSVIDILMGSMVKRPIIEENEGKKMKNIGEDKR